MHVYALVVINVLNNSLCYSLLCIVEVHARTQFLKISQELYSKCQTLLAREDAIKPDSNHENVSFTKNANTQYVIDITSNNIKSRDLMTT